MNIEKLCMGCMQEVLDGDCDFCPECGYKADAENSSRGLQPRTILYGKYLVGRVIGEGGFGITYIAYDLVLNTRVAIKEYFPSELVTRDTTNGLQTSLTVLTGSKEEQYKKGIERFVREAANLAKFNDLPGIVSVKEFFYENNTAYMVMEYIDGITLSNYLESNGGKLPYAKVMEMMIPLMTSLEKVHEAGMVHRDISPDNIMITVEGKVKLIDFGAARIVNNEDVKSLTVILKHGYAPAEQYQPNGNQGPWTDVYALSATMYRMITGVIPQESTDRIMSGDRVQPISRLIPDIPKNISDGLMHGLGIKAASRTQNINELKKELCGTKKRINYPLILSIAAVLVLAIGIGLFVIHRGKNSADGHEHEVSDTEEEVIRNEEEQNEIADLEEDEEIEEIEELYLYTAKHADFVCSPDQPETVIYTSGVGDELKVIELGDEWTEVEYNGNSAFVESEKLVSEDDYRKWKDYYNQVLELTGVERDGEGRVRVNRSLWTLDYEQDYGTGMTAEFEWSDELLGLFEDFNCDGIKELFICISVSNDQKIWFVNEDGCELVEDAWGNVASDKSFVSEILREIPINKNILVEFPWMDCWDAQYYSHYMLTDDGPKIISGTGFYDGFGWTARYQENGYPDDYIKCYSINGEEMYLQQIGIRFFPVWVLNNELCECASVEISEEDFMLVPGADQIIEKCMYEWEPNTSRSSCLNMKENYYCFSDMFDSLDNPDDLGIDYLYVMRDNTLLNQGQYGLTINVEEIQPTSYQYNEMGFFVVNFVIDVSWYDYSTGNYLDYGKIDPGYEPNGVYDRIDIDSSFYNYSIIDSTQYVDKLTGHAIVSYLDGELKIVYMHWGEQPLYSGEMQVLMTSDFSNFQGLGN